MLESFRSMFDVLPSTVTENRTYITSTPPSPTHKRLKVSSHDNCIISRKKRTRNHNFYSARLANDCIPYAKLYNALYYLHSYKTPSVTMLLKFVEPIYLFLPLGAHRSHYFFSASPIGILIYARPAPDVKNIAQAAPAHIMRARDSGSNRI